MSDYEDMTVAQLKELRKEAGLPVSVKNPKKMMKLKMTTSIQITKTRMTGKMTTSTKNTSLAKSQFYPRN